jgi:predicted DNA-binding protein
MFKNKNKEKKAMIKSEALKVRLTIEENNTFKKIANDIGETRSRLLRKMIREAINNDIDLLTDEQSLLKIAIRQLVGIANNLNQITAAIHSDKSHRTINEHYLNELRNHIIAVRKTFESHVKKTKTRWIKDSCDILMK